MDIEQENSILLHINERLFYKGLITQALYDHAKEVIVQRR